MRESESRVKDRESRESGRKREIGRNQEGARFGARGGKVEYRSGIHMYVGRGYNVFKLREKGLYLPAEGYIGDG